MPNAHSCPRCLQPLSRWGCHSLVESALPGVGPGWECQAPRDPPVPPTGDFKPSAVDLGGSFPPLAGTMGKSELEAAATLLVRACQAKGDRWQPLTPDDLAAVMKDDVAAKREPLASLIGNPFWRPDPFGLVK